MRCLRYVRRFIEILMNAFLINYECFISFTFEFIYKTPYCLL